ncbi:GNAT family N-acetyltransferase [Deinococcus sp.]|uniref:GNAT family N-acetyltransferase n=1 Tax=Deinococcus sp. TaxID=47478 RepID=UPI003C7BCDE7
MLRAAVQTDTPGILALAVQTRMFLPTEVEPLQQEFDGFHAGLSGEGYGLEVWTDDLSGPPVGVVYFGPNRLSDRAWDLWMIAVAPDRQGQGLGGQLLQATETRVRSGGGHLLIIETSSEERFDSTHAFYIRHGYAEVGRIPDFYADGESKVIFSKRLT